MDHQSVLSDPRTKIKVTSREGKGRRQREREERELAILTAVKSSGASGSPRARCVRSQMRPEVSRKSGQIIGVNRRMLDSRTARVVAPGSRVNNVDYPTAATLH